jgi:hypothetical protein
MTTTTLTFQSKLSDSRLEVVQMNDALLGYSVETLPEEGDYAVVVSATGNEIPGEVVYVTPAGKPCEYGCADRIQHVHVSIS